MKVYLAEISVLPCQWYCLLKIRNFIKIIQTFNGAAAIITNFNDDKSYLFRVSDCARSNATGGTMCAQVALCSSIFRQNKSNSNAGRPHVKLPNHMPCTTIVPNP